MRKLFAANGIQYAKNVFDILRCVLFDRFYLSG